MVAPLVWAGAAAVVSGIASARASGRAADKAAEGAERSAADVQASGELARRDIERIFPQAKGDLLAGAASAADIFSQSVGEQQRLFTGGNVNAQNTLGQSFGNIQNALLGLPVDQSQFAAKDVTLSQPIANPIGTPIGGGQVEGGVFSNLATNVQQNRLLEGEAGRIADLVARAEGGAQNEEAIKAQRELAARGFDPFGRPLGEGGAEAITGSLDRRGIERLIDRAANQTGAGRSEAIEGLRRRGFDQSGNPLTAGQQLPTRHTADVLRLIDRAANQTGAGQSEAINGLRLRGFDSLGNPLGSI